MRELVPLPERNVRKAGCEGAARCLILASFVHSFPRESIANTAHLLADRARAQDIETVTVREIQCGECTGRPSSP